MGWREGGRERGREREREVLITYDFSGFKNHFQTSFLTHLPFNNEYDESKD